MKKYIVTLLSFLLIFVMLTKSGTVYAEDTLDRDCLNSVVYVQSTIPDKDPKEQNPCGTGFFIGKKGEDPQYIVTNCHVIADYVISGGSSGNSSLFVAFDKNTVEEAYIVDYDATRDIAILKLAKATDKRKPLTLKLTDESVIGSTAFALGFPGRSNKIVDSTTYYGKDDITVSGGRVSRRMVEAKKGRQLMQIDIVISGGNSGGPLVNSKGEAIGINTLADRLQLDGGIEIPLNSNFAVNIEELIPVLEKNNIFYELVPVKDVKLRQYFFLALGASALAVLFITVLFILKRKKKNAPVPVSAVKPARAAIPNQAAPETGAGLKSTHPVVKSMSNQHGGMTIALTGQPLLIGRDVSACRLIFKEGTNGVSAKHCQIYFDESSNCFVLIDLKSTYGTFLANGQRLSPNVPYTLKKMDSFYLGEQDNVLYVDMEG